MVAIASNTDFFSRVGLPIAVLSCWAVVASGAPSSDTEFQADAESPYLLLFAGDEDEADSDFLAVIDLRPDSPDLGKAVATTLVDLKASMPHRMEYFLPPAGELLFMNAQQISTVCAPEVMPRGSRVGLTSDCTWRVRRFGCSMEGQAGTACQAPVACY